MQQQKALGDAAVDMNLSWLFGSLSINIIFTVICLYYY